MRDCDPIREKEFFNLFLDYFDSEKDAGKQHDPANYSLDRMVPLAEAAGNPQRFLKVVHIAGTKGKGTTSHFCSALLAASHRRVGLFTSPHVATVRERFQLDNQLVSYELLMKGATELLAAVRERQLKPSLFELFTVLALKLFAEQNMEYAVMETGIGGRLDATNYIRHPEITIVTPVSFDHVALLGNTIQAIASEKAGIIKPGVPLVISRQPYADGEAVLRNKAAELESPVIQPLPLEETAGFLPARYPRFLQENFSSALAAVRALGFAPQAQDFVLPQLRARFEVVRTNPLVIMDGAHNADSMEKLVSSLTELYPDTSWTVVLGCVKGKDIHGITQALRRLPNASCILTNPHTGKGSALELLEQEVRGAGLAVQAVIPDLQRLDQLPQDRPLLFTGSFFTANIAEQLYN